MRGNIFRMRMYENLILLLHIAVVWLHGEFCCRQCALRTMKGLELPSSSVAVEKLESPVIHAPRICPNYYCLSKNNYITPNLVKHQHIMMLKRNDRVRNLRRALLGGLSVPHYLWPQLGRLEWPMGFCGYRQ